MRSVVETKKKENYIRMFCFDFFSSSLLFYGVTLGMGT